jgi:hypothetical protein
MKNQDHRHSESDLQLALLRKNVASLREISISIGEEIDSQQTLLDNFSDTMGRGQIYLKGAYGKLKEIGERISSGAGSYLWMFFLFFVGVILFLKLFFR